MPIPYIALPLNKGTSKSGYTPKASNKDTAIKGKVNIKAHILFRLLFIICLAIKQIEMIKNNPIQ